MKSGTSCCERGGWFSTALLRKNISRFSPIWGIYTLILFVIMPMPMFMSQLSGYGQEPIYLNGFIQSAIIFGLLYGIIMAMGLFSYLMNPRSAQLLHSLPLRREGLFLTNWVSGALFILVPNLVIALLSAVAVVLSGRADTLAGLGMWFVVMTVVELFFFAMAIFCGMFTGNLLAMPVLYGILNLLALGISFLISVAVELLTVGISLNLDFGVTKFLTPCYFMAERLGDYWDDMLPFEELLALMAYTLIGCAIFSLLALAIYRLRQLERAGDLITVGWMRPVFQTCMGMGLGMLLGWFTYVGFFQDQGYRVWLFIVLSTFWAVFFSVAARMLLKKTLRVWKTGWKGFVLTGLAMVVLLVGVKLDLPGRQSYVPKAEEVEHINMSVTGNFHYFLELRDPEQIEQLTQLHAAMLERPDLLQSSEFEGVSDLEYPYLQSSNNTRVRFMYFMEDGSSLERYYHFNVRAEDLTDPASAASMLEDFLNQPEVAFVRHFDGMSRAEVERSSVVEATVSGNEETIQLAAVQAQQLMEAVIQDLAAGRVRVSLLWDQDAWENDYLNVEFYLATKPEPAEAAGDEPATQPVAMYYHLPIQHSCTSTLAALEEMGYLPQP